MKLRVDRVNETKNSTLGNFFINNIRQCYTLEDDYDEIKVPGETRIPAGTYFVELRYEGGFYKRYSEKFGEDHPMLWIRNVPNFTFVLIHILNYHTETDACIGPGNSFGIDRYGDYYLKNSTKAYKKIYYPIRNAIAGGESVTIEIGDTVSIKPKKKTIPSKIIEKTELPKLLVWKKNGFKRKLGATVTVIAGILSVIPQTSAIGQGLLVLGGLTTTVGGLDALKKNREKDSSTYVDDNKVLRFIADLIIGLINQYVKKKGK